MSCWIRSSVMGLLGGLLLGGLAGCQNGDGGSAGGSPQPATSGKPDFEGRFHRRASWFHGGADGGSRRYGAGPLDRRQATLGDCERRGEGGRSERGSDARLRILWSPSKAELIKDEPLAVKVPAGLQPLTPKIYVPSANPITKGKYELGRQLYFDPRVSLDSTVSCATCHNPAQGWTDGMAVSIGIGGQTRRSQRSIGHQHCVWQDDVLGRPRSFARGPGARANSEPDRDGRSEVPDRSSSALRRSRRTRNSSRRCSDRRSRSTGWPRRSPRSSGSPLSRATRPTTSTTRATTRLFPTAEKRGLVLVRTDAQHR